MLQNQFLLLILFEQLLLDLLLLQYHLAAFANTRGGFLVIGVGEDRFGNPARENQSQ